MKKPITVLMGAGLVVLGIQVAVAMDATWEYAVRVSAAVKLSPPKITLNWPQDTQVRPNSYTVYRKSQSGTSWGSGIALPGNATSFVDTNLTAGCAYEYQIVKATPTYTGYGYIFSGINAPLIEHRGKVILMVDKTCAHELQSELARLEQDLAGDGWTVLRHEVAREENVRKVKALITADYRSDPANVRTVFLFGHLPVPYSGNIIPDGHYPDHQGAWPADAYYGDMEGEWTDSTVSTALASDARNRNSPGDGKFDQSQLPAPLALEVGRVDLANLPGRTSMHGPATFPSELQLLRQYLNKDHDFRQAVMIVPRRALLHDDFGFRGGEAFAASGYRNLAPLFGAENVLTLTNRGEWIPTLAGERFLWAYGCGAGSYTSMGGLGNTGQYNDGTTIEVVRKDIKAVFTMVFGSWFGDWDSEDNIMRAVLATPTEGLTAAWSGRPHWFFHHMALGENIGYSARLTQNNGPNGLYRTQVNSAAGQIHIALMGDPTLRMHIVAPPSGVVAKGSTLSWTASPDGILGYHVYRAPTLAGRFTRLTDSLLQETTFTDPNPVADAPASYMVRAVKLENTPSGTYFNASQGAFAAPEANLPIEIPLVHSAPVKEGEPAAVRGLQVPVKGFKPIMADAVAPMKVSSKISMPANSLTVVSNRPPPTGVETDVIWVDDDVPNGAARGADGGDGWNWVSSNPPPFSGTRASQSPNAPGLHQHFFDWANATLKLNSGDKLYAYVFLDPNHLPSEAMLQWNDGSWEHRAYWGANKIAYGINGNPSCTYAGPLPPAGQWARLEVPASQVGLEGAVLKGMAFSLFDGSATWDAAGRSAPPVVLPGPTITPTNTFVWVDDALPTGAVPGADGGDGWTWVSRNPSPFSGSRASQSTGGPGLHQHFFSWATATLPIHAGDYLFTYVYLDPAHVPTEAMLQWNDGTWEHRAYWGANKISYGIDGTSTRQYMGPLPPPGQWAPLVVPASQVALEGATVKGMSFSLFDGSATWDYAGRSTQPLPVQPAFTNSLPSTTTNTLAVVTDANATPVTGTNGGSGSYVAPTLVNVVDYLTLELPKPGDSMLHVLSPTLLELKLINAKQPDPAKVAIWDFVNSSLQFSTPSLQEFSVSVNGQPAAVQSVGFKRRPLYAPLVKRDLRIENCLYLQLANPIADGQTVEVKNPSGNLWPSSMGFSSTTIPLRFSPAIHVNQEGYVPSFPKKAAVGYYTGNLGEMDIASSTGFKLVDAITGAEVFQGALVAKPDVGYKYSPVPYQKVFTADFTSFTTPGEYRLKVPGLGASLPFLIDDGIAMGFARVYALGLYHQRCGTDNSLPFTRHTHGPCHTALAEVPSPQSAFPFTWTTIAGKSADFASFQSASTPQLKDEASQLFPYVNKGKVDVSGGHHDAGDYSKYTINCAGLVHYLMHAVDSFPGVAALDNLGIPESGDGISDLMQEAKWEADYIAKLQDADGGFYFLVYPRDREYESNVLPDQGDSQVVWPKNTSATACSVAALAQCASSPLFKKQYPAEAALYLQKARLGWQFLMTAIAKYGKDGAYQEVTFYGNEFIHNDELAWAACQMYLATGDPAYQQQLIAWFDPSDPGTWRWGWWRMWESYGRAIRSYAFAAKSGRLQASQIDAAFLAKCENQILLCAQENVTRSIDNAYGTSFPLETKAVQSAGWYFSSERAFDITVGYQLDPRPAFLEAILANLNYEGGCNPVNVSYITGMGWRRQREIVSQYAWNDRRVLPPSGIPLGNIQTTFSWMDLYKGELGSLVFPQEGAGTAPYPFYDRWADSFNLSTEFVGLDQARSLSSLAFLATLTPASSRPWKSVPGKIIAPADGLINTPMTATLQVPGLDLKGARIVWEARDQEPHYGASFTFSPTNSGSQWIEAEAQWPDGRRVFAVTEGSATNTLPTVTVAATTPAASEIGSVPGVFTFTRVGATSTQMTINYHFSGTAAKWTNYRRIEGDMPEFVTIPAGAASATLTIYPVAGNVLTSSETAILTLSPDPAYNLGQPKSATVTITENPL